MRDLEEKEEARRKEEAATQEVGRFKREVSRAAQDLETAQLELVSFPSDVLARSAMLVGAYSSATELIDSWSCRCVCFCCDMFLAAPSHSKGNIESPSAKAVVVWGGGPGNSPDLRGRWACFPSFGRPDDDIPDGKLE